MSELSEMLESCARCCDCKACSYREKCPTLPVLLIHAAHQLERLGPLVEAPGTPKPMSKESDRRVLRVMRQEKHLTMDQAGELAGVAGVTWRGWERGMLKPKWDLIEAVLPGVQKRREEGCAARCKDRACLGGSGKCSIKRRGTKK